MSADIKNVIVHGAYRLDNFGDTLLLSLIQHYINTLGFRVLLSGGSLKTLRHLSGEVALFDGNVNDADALIYGGGGYFGEPPNAKLRWNLHLIRKHLPIAIAMRRRGKPYGCFGVGLGPLSFPLSRWLVSRILNRANKVVLRDEQSKIFGAEYGITAQKINLSADLALLMNDEPLFSSWALESNSSPMWERSKYKVFAIHPSISIEADKAQESLAFDVKNALSFNSNIRVILLSDRNSAGQDDARKSWQRFLGLEDRWIFRYESPRRLCRLIANSDVILTNKLHVGIVAATYRKTPIAVAKHSKTRRFYRQLGRSELCRDLSGYKRGDLTDLIEQALSGSLPSVNVPRSVIELSRQNLKHIDEMLISLGSKETG